MFLWTQWATWIKVIVSIFVVIPPSLLLMYLFIIQPHQIKGDAMNPNYFNNQYVITKKFTYHFSIPARGDVIVFSNPSNKNQEHIKRIIGLPGEKIKIFRGIVFINGKTLKENYLKENTLTSAGSFLQENIEIIIPDNNYFVMGDNRDNSSDSRSWGFITKEDIIGKI